MHPHAYTRRPAIVAARSNPEARHMLHSHYPGHRVANVRRGTRLPNGAHEFHATMVPAYAGNPGGMPGLGAFLGVSAARILSLAVVVPLMWPINGPRAVTGEDLDAPEDTPKEELDKLVDAELQAQYAQARKDYAVRPWIAGFVRVGATVVGARLGARLAADDADKDIAGRYAMIAGGTVALLSMVGAAFGAKRPEYALTGNIAAAVGAYVAKGKGGVPAMV